MKLTPSIARYLAASPRLQHWALVLAHRTPYFDIYGPDGSLYMRRWWLMPRWTLYRNEAGNLMPRRWMPFALRIHHIVRPDSDRHLHNHPFDYRSFILRGWYIERSLQGLCCHVTGTTYTARAEHLHSITDVSENGVWTLFLTGPRINDWGFLVGERLVPWREYLEQGSVAE